MTSQEIIQQIVTYHPIYEAGMKRNWSYWHAGQTGGRGDWLYLNLIFAPENELRKCLEELVIENEEFKLRWNPYTSKPEENE